MTNNDRHKIAMTNSTHTSTGLKALLVAAACLLVVMLAAAAPASADFGISSFTGTVQNQDGSADTQAGSHPFSVTTQFTFNMTTDNTGAPIPDGAVKDVQVDLPPGLIGDPHATPKCSQADFRSLIGGGQGCPRNTQIGTTALGVLGTTLNEPVYNLEAPKGVPAEFGFIALVVPVTLDATVRTGGDYGLTVNLKNIAQGLPLAGSSLTFWGVPADPGHDTDRGGPVDGPLKPFLTLPTACNGPQTTTLHADSWENPGAFHTASFDTPTGADGCDRLDFQPSITIQPDTHAADSPTGLGVDLKIPQNSDPNGLGEEALKKTVVTLPPGFSVNPSAADGLVGCTPAQIGIDNASEPTCPDASKIGTSEIDTPLLDTPLKGSLYLAQPGANPFSSLLAIYLVAEGGGTLVKLPGQVAADPSTGQLVATFDNTPQLPFTEFKLNFDGGPRAALATPPTCGSNTASAQMTSVNGVSVSRTDSFNINQNCGGGFSPSYTAGAIDTLAGGNSGFTMTAGRGDGQQHIKSLSATLPPGLLANVGSVPLCGDAEAAAGTCSDASQVGTTMVGAGAGSHPFYLGGKVFLTGPYKGGPFGLSIVVPAVAGPFNLGTVVVRAAIQVDPHDAHLTVTSDDLPSILQGIPLRIRSIEVDVNKPGFMFNPTNCSVMSSSAVINSLEGASAPVSSRFQVGGCAGLAFSPSMTTKLTGGKANTKANKHPGLSVVVKSPKGQANLKSVQLTLPKALTLNLNSAAACSQAQLASNSCPASSRYGSAKATTPVLGAALTGPVYLVVPQGGGLPGLAVVLSGSGVNLTLDAKTAILGGRLRNTFATIPDVPITQFALTLKSGKGALLTPRAGLCSKKQTSSLVMTGQNGKRVSKTITLSNSCPKARKKKSKKAKKKSHKTAHLVGALRPH
jgi:hypothetical protein